jgi:DNA-binding transcriptional ArsR family regulator
MLNVKTEQDERLVKFMNILGDNTRFKMFKILLDKKELCVSDIAEELNVSVSAVSQHFRIFELARIVKKERNGQKICHKLNEDNDLVVKFKAVLSN